MKICIHCWGVQLTVKFLKVIPGTRRLLAEHKSGELELEWGTAPKLWPTATREERAFNWRSSQRRSGEVQNQSNQPAAEGTVDNLGGSHSGRSIK